MKRFVFIIVLSSAFSALLPLSVLAGSEDAGTAAYSFLKVGVSARGQGMGGAMVALADDEYAGYYNPAGLGQLIPIMEIEDDYGDIQIIEGDITKHFAASYNNYLADIQAGYITFLMRRGENGMLGFAIDYFNYGSFDQVDNNNVKTGTFGASDLAFAVSYGHRVNSSFFWGLTGKFIYEKLQDYSSDGAAFDAGLVYKLGDRRTGLGFALKNIGVQLKGLTSEHKDKLPGALQAGVSHDLKGAPLIFSGQIDYPFDYDISGSVGVEFTGADPLLIRIGWDSKGRDYETGSSRDKLGGFSGGFGYYWGDYKFDYSYSSFADIGDIHRISVAAGF